MRHSAIYAPLLALALLGLAAPAPAGPARTLPALAATTLTGEHLAFGPRQHQVTVVHFWATWCLPCRVEMPLLDAAWARHKGQGLALIGIALDAGASRAKVAEAGHGVNFPLARLGETTLPPRLVPPALPETLVYDRAGRLRYRFGHGGPALDGAALDRAVATLLSEP